LRSAGPNARNGVNRSHEASHVEIVAGYFLPRVESANVVRRCQMVCVSGSFPIEGVHCVHD